MQRHPALVLALALVACGSSGRVIGDMSTPPLDAEADMHAAPLTLTVDGKPTTLAAWYSFYVRPLSDEPSDVGVYLVVTAIDPSFTCSGGAPSGDAISFMFLSAKAGVDSSQILARSGPDLASTSGGTGYLQLTTVDDKLMGYDLDGGVVEAGMGSVSGEASFAIGSSITLDGSFTAKRCALLDFIIPG